jgi:hypothetical protein
MNDVLIGREKECADITDLMSRKKHVIIFGAEGVGKTAIIDKLLSENQNSSRFLYSKESKTLKEALINIISFNTGADRHIKEKNILSLRKMFYPLLDKEPQYIIFDHIEYVDPKYYLFLEYLIERKLPLMIAGQGTDKKSIGYLRMLLFNFKKVEICALSRMKTDEMVNYYIGRFDIKVVQMDTFKKDVFHFSNGNPGIVKKICSMAVDAKYQKKGFIDVMLINLDRRIGYIGNS